MTKERKKPGRRSKCEPIHYQAMKLKLEGHTPTEIAKILNQKERTVKSWFYEKAFFKEEFEKMKQEATEDAMDTIVGAGEAAAKRLVELLTQSRGGQVNLNAALEVLKIIGISGVNKSEIKMDSTVKNKHSIDEDMLNDPDIADQMMDLFEKIRGEDNE